MNSYSTVKEAEVEALKRIIPISFASGSKSSISPKGIGALYRAKKHDEEHTRIKGIVHRLKSIGVNADVVERVHYITLSEEVS